MDAKSLKQVQQAMLDKLRTSLLTPRHAAALRLEPAAEGHALDVNPKWAGFKIPYFDLRGRETSFFRFRFLQYQPSTGFGAEVEGPKKPLRYAQPKGSALEAYFPPLLGDRSWERVSKDPSVPIGLTEGELKAACCCANGILPMVGLGGVFNWQSARLNLPLIPSLEAFDWNGRAVYLVFDSDAASNPMVRVAQSRLTKALRMRGARMFVGSIPPAPDGGKQGIDDLAFREGAAAAEDVIASAEADEAAAELHAMNEEYAFVHETAEVVEFATGMAWDAGKFVSSVAKNRVYMEKTLRTGKNGQTSEHMEKKFTAKEWMEWPRRAQFSRFAYEPGEPKIVGDKVNVWSGWACEPKPGDVSPWIDLMEAMFPGETGATLEYLRQWFAWPIRNPGAKLHTAVVVWGSEQGTGKTLLGTTMKRIYGENFRSIGNTELVGAYNEWAANRQFVVGDEISTGSRRAITDMMKDVITRESVTVNAKYRAHYTVRDCINYYFTSNHPDAFFVTDQDRRYLVLEATREAKPPEFYQKYAEWLRGPGAAALFHHLAVEVDLEGFDPKGRAPMTNSKANMVADGRGDLDEWLSRLLDDPEGTTKRPWALWTTQELVRLYDPDGRTKVTANGIARALRPTSARQPAGGTAVPTSAGRVRLWALKDWERFAFQGPAAVAKAYDEERAASDPKRKFEQKRAEGGKK